MNVLTALTILYITSSISSYTSLLHLGYYTKGTQSDKKEIVLNLTYSPFIKKPFGNTNRLKNCNTQAFTANEAKFNKEMQINFKVQLNVICKYNNEKNMSFEWKTITWN